MEDCLICLEPIVDNYAVINNEYEQGIYHTYCLQTWLKDNPRGIKSREKPKSYIVFNNGVASEIFVTEPVEIIVDPVPLPSPPVNNLNHGPIPNNNRRCGCNILVFLVLLGLFGLMIFFLCYFIK